MIGNSLVIYGLTGPLILRESPIDRNQSCKVSHTLSLIMNPSTFMRSDVLKGELSLPRMGVCVVISCISLVSFDRLSIVEELISGAHRLRL